MHGPWTTSLTSDEYIFFSHFEGCISWCLFSFVPLLCVIKKVTDECV
jgi:hypothetical protein